MTKQEIKERDALLELEAVMDRIYNFARHAHREMKGSFRDRHAWFRRKTRRLYRRFDVLSSIVWPK